MKKQEAIQQKICDIKPLMHEIAMWRFRNKKIIFTNGCFDILHAGHIHLLNACTELENNYVLIVGLNSDASVKRLKGESRPINNFDTRAKVLASLYAVDAVIQFEEDTPIELIKMIQPDVLVKGGDYKEDEIVGADIVKQNGGRIVVIPFLAGYSTTKILESSKQ
ncbi:MAG: D-glycero-beta-D-manno-heptose 1-phosphate adenylyltransferase [Fimbriimonadaceae bacterium]|nr:D-glycero-beta-D-manno-heptose 1-phosphate adenylyltransferase [Chitinophagales bacterium]